VWPLVGLLTGIALIAGAQAFALSRVDSQGALDPALLDPLLRFAPLLLPALLLMSTFSTPLRLEVAEVSWVLTAPGGMRALLARALLLRPVGYAAMGLLGASIARWLSGHPLHHVWKVALVGALVGLAVRLVSFGAHLLVVRVGAAVTLRVLAVAWGSVLLAAALGNLPVGEWLGLRPVLERMLDVALQPAQHSAIPLLGALGVLLAASLALVANARGLEERAQALARQVTEAQEALRGLGRQELTAPPLRRKLPSLSFSQAFPGERALCFRGIAQLRRQVLPSFLLCGLLLDLGLPLILLEVAPAFTWAWALVVLAGAVAGGASQLAVELDHYHLRLAPLRPLRALLWVSAVPSAHRIVSIELAWFPVLFAPRITTGTWLAGVVLGPCLVALAAATGSLAVASSRELLARAALKAAIATLAVLPAAVILIVAAALGSTTLAAVMAAVALLATTAFCVRRTAHTIWPKETL
jgi:hypothetical protein